ncbi:uncharacterized protein EI97DRAFT_221702 [Westerdykella ornata]|uniref:Uncharacterized protein n=1 Tax=Westerdykella ornata TaxID=318751 RepID=A0A6A6JUY9_WESOR|nr:uncharacterized protein EI97DRAFT_221702 [Westerdykella ornata]KAF2278859.1 hypothetical protein EI97DRAFT_221702 [Westerdykella ornata]
MRRGVGIVIVGAWKSGRLLPTVEINRSQTPASLDKVITIHDGLMTPALGWTDQAGTAYSVFGNIEYIHAGFLRANMPVLIVDRPSSVTVRIHGVAVSANGTCYPSLCEAAAEHLFPPHGSEKLNIPDSSHVRIILPAINSNSCHSPFSEGWPSKTKPETCALVHRI